MLSCHPQAQKITAQSARSATGVCGVLNQKLANIAEDFELPLWAVHDVCLLHRKHNTSNAYWERWNQLHSPLSYELMKAVGKALEETPRASLWSKT